jgi:hypothetical protein
LRTPINWYLHVHLKLVLGPICPSALKYETRPTWLDGIDLYVDHGNVPVVALLQRLHDNSR